MNDNDNDNPPNKNQNLPNKNPIKLNNKRNHDDNKKNHDDNKRNRDDNKRNHDDNKKNRDDNKRNRDDDNIIIHNKPRTFEPKNNYPNRMNFIDLDDFDILEKMLFGDYNRNLEKDNYREEKAREEKAREEQEELKKDLMIVDKKINTLDDLIELGKSYDSTKRYNIDMKMLNKLVEPLTELNNLIGMRKVKNDIIDHIIFYLQKLDNKNVDMLHTVIEGPPGVGKTELGKILGKIYLGMGILKNNVFKKVSRSDMIAKYLGQTASKTEDLINSCKGGVMFIDEVYSLGNKDTKDSFSKEAIDTLNMKLSDMKNDFICIVAGYPREIDECFFAYNIGLNSRFPVRFSIDPYTPIELLKIFKQFVEKNEWTLDISIKPSFFKKNYDEFKNYGRDMELLFTKCKRSHSKRIFDDKNSTRKEITLDDLNIAFENFLLNK